MKLCTLILTLASSLVVAQTDEQQYLRRSLNSDPRTVAFKTGGEDLRRGLNSGVSLDPGMVAQTTGGEDLRRGLNSGVSLDPRTVALKTGGEEVKRKRKFVSYSSSKWETMWLDRVDSWAESRSICDVLQAPEQSPFVHDFLQLSCAGYYEAPYNNWCIIHDEFHPMWYNTANREAFELLWKPPFPGEVKLQGPLQPVVPGPQHEHIVSKYVFLDETTGEQYTEYIEPLVSHLRFPLAGCIKIVPEDPLLAYYDVMHRGWIIPPPPTTRRDRAVYFDAGASNWSSGRGGPSLQFFDSFWKRSGIDFNEIYAFEMTTTPEDFYATVPDEFHTKVVYQQCPVSSQASGDSRATPFIPNLIKRKTSPNDYVLFKLDIDSPIVENGNIDFILNDPDSNIDEILWEHHIQGNYMMVKLWGAMEAQDKLTLRQSYEYFLRMRQKGIRAHSWV